jgi:hypothetical protein
VYDLSGDGEDFLYGFSDRLDGEPVGAVFPGGGIYRIEIRIGKQFKVEG